jgi:hypothetical protein
MESLVVGAVQGLGWLGEASMTQVLLHVIDGGGVVIDGFGNAPGVVGDVCWCITGCTAGRSVNRGCPAAVTLWRKCQDEAVLGLCGVGALLMLVYCWVMRAADADSRPGQVEQQIIFV